MALTFLPGRSIRHTITRHVISHRTYTTYHHSYISRSSHSSGGGLVICLIVLAVIVVIALTIKRAANRG